MRRYTDEQGSEVRLTDERLRHILQRHGEVARQLHRFAETLAEPDAVTMSSTRPNTHHYYRLYPDLQGRRRYLCLVVRRMQDYSFIVTAYPDRKIKGVLL